MSGTYTSLIFSSKFQGAFLENKDNYHDTIAIITYGFAPIPSFLLMTLSPLPHCAVQSHSKAKCDNWADHQSQFTEGI